MTVSSPGPAGRPNAAGVTGWPRAAPSCPGHVLTGPPDVLARGGTRRGSPPSRCRQIGRLHRDDRVGPGRQQGASHDPVRRARRQGEWIGAARQDVRGHRQSRRMVGVGAGVLGAHRVPSIAELSNTGSDSGASTSAASLSPPPRPGRPAPAAGRDQPATTCWCSETLRIRPGTSRRSTLGHRPQPLLDLAVVRLPARVHQLRVAAQLPGNRRVRSTAAEDRRRVGGGPQGGQRSSEC